MKRNESGVMAYHVMLRTPVPEATTTYKFMSHHEVISNIKKEIVAAGYHIMNEQYNCTADGWVATGRFGINYASDPDIMLSVNFLNSYTKQNGFALTMGGMIKSSGCGFMLDEKSINPKVDTNTFLPGAVIEMLNNDAEAYWKALVVQKDLFQKHNVSQSDIYVVLGKLFFEKSLINTMQMNMIKNQFSIPSECSCWDLYFNASTAITETHPANFIKSSIAFHSTMWSFMEEKILKNAYTINPVEKKDPYLSYEDMVTDTFSSKHTW